MFFFSSEIHQNNCSQLSLTGMMLTALKILQGTSIDWWVSVHVYVFMIPREYGLNVYIQAALCWYKYSPHRLLAQIYVTVSQWCVCGAYNGYGGPLVGVNWNCIKVLFNMFQHFQDTIWLACLWSLRKSAEHKLVVAPVQQNRDFNQFLVVMDKHCKHCECCPVSILIVRS